MRFAISVIKQLRVALELVAALIVQGAQADHIVLAKQRVQTEQVFGTDMVALQLLAEMPGILLLGPGLSKRTVDRHCEDNPGQNQAINWFKQLARHNPCKYRALSHDYLQNGKVLLILHLSGTEQQELIYNRLLLSYATGRFHLVELAHKKHEKITANPLDDI